MFFMSSYRTLLPLQYPSHSLALGGLYVACFLTSFEQPPSDDPEKTVAIEITQQLKRRGDWERKYRTQVEDLEGQPQRPQKNTKAS
jgi:CTD kinase subunit beta